MIERVGFESRIAAALIAGERKCGRSMSQDAACQHARHVADKLWPLFVETSE